MKKCNIHLSSLSDNDPVQSLVNGMDDRHETLSPKSEIDPSMAKMDGWMNDEKENWTRDEFLATLLKKNEEERLVGQTVLAQLVSIKNCCLQVLIIGCATISEASYKDFKLYSEHEKIDDLPKTISIRIDSVSVGQTLSIIPMTGNFGAPHSSSICKYPFFSNKFKVIVTYWQTHNIAYVLSVRALNLEQSLLKQLVKYYNNNGDQEFVSETLCAVKSADENWYRAEIVLEQKNEVIVRYLDYGNYEIIPKTLVKRLEHQFFETPVLAIKVYLPLTEAHDNKISIEQIDALTSETVLDLKVLDYYSHIWIVDMFNDGDSILLKQRLLAIYCL